VPVHNADIARIFEEIAELLELEDANPFRVRAYRNAARVVGEQRFDIAERLAKDEALPKLPGIGKDLSAKIKEIAASGTCALRERLAKRAPAGITELLHLPGLGPKRVRTLNRELEVHSLAQLVRAAKDGRLRTLSGFGAKTEKSLLDAALAQLGTTKRFKLAVAGEYAKSLVAHLEKTRGVKNVAVAGSYRRMKETVGDLDLLVTADTEGAAQAAMQRFVAYGEVKKVLAQGATRASVVLASGLQVDLRVVPSESAGAALHYFTGSKAHNIALRRMAQAKKLKVNEYGVFRGERRIAGETEESVYAVFGLPWIPPELREDQGEIEAARQGGLPKLVALEDLKGDLHAHTKATDGRNSLEDMAQAAQARGFTYLAITEHSRRVTVAHGLDPQRLARQVAAIDALNAKLKGITLLKGIEVDILEDGALDLPDSALEPLDLVVGAVHSRFKLSRARQTERILAAMDSPFLSILAHPSGRLIDAREPYDVDMLAIVRKARSRGIALELNAHPERLDLTDVHCHMAKDEGVPVCVNSDAHSVDDFDNLRYGIGQARRGWLEKGDVLNTRPLAALKKFLARRRS
jgi:DNA polymerase (family 10)